MEKQYPTKYPSDVSDEEWAFLAPYLTLCREDAPQREHALRAVFNGLRYIVRTGNQWRFMPGDLPPWTAVYQQTQRWMPAGVFEILVEDVRSLLREFAGRKPQPTAMIVDSRTLQSTPESGARAGYDGAKRRKGSKVHAAVDTLGHLLALHVTAASEQDRAQVERLAEEVQQITGRSVELAYVDQGYTGQTAADAAAQHGIQLEVVKHTEAKMRVRVAAKKMGRRAKLRLGRSFPPTRQRLRTTRPLPRRLPLLRLRLDHARPAHLYAELSLRSTATSATAAP